MEIFILLLFLGLTLLLCFGYIIMHTVRANYVSANLTGANNRALMMGEKYMMQAAMARSQVFQQNKRLTVLAKQLDLSAQELGDLNEMKSKFLSMVVHDVRSPLASIKGFSQMLSGRISGEREKAQLGKIIKSADQLNRLISDLTDLAMIEEGKLSVNRQPMDLRLITQDVLPDMQVIASQKSIILLAMEPETPVNVTGDRHRLGQVLRNLVTNAFKFTPAGGTVQVRLAADGAYAVVYVKDSGIGVHSSETARIFERFYQSKYQKDAGLRKQGWGLGLSIAGDIIKSHKGDLAVKSPGLGKGSTFHFRVPLLKE